LARERGRIRLFRGVKEVLLELKASGTPLLLLTSSPEEHSVALLRKERVDVFSRYYLGTSVSNKARAIKKAVRDAGVAPSDMIYVADEIKDAESCVQSGVRMIGVGWGMNDGGALVEAGAIRLVERTDALLTTLREYLPSVRSRPP
jgi:phosphoglycolate phosphatase